MTGNTEERVTRFEVNGEEVVLSDQIVRDYLVSGNADISNQEVKMFTALCKYQKLNPFLKEAYLVKYKNKNGPDKPAQLIVSKEAFMKRAESHNQYNGFIAGIIVARGEEMHDLEGAVKMPNDQLIGGWAKVYREDRKGPITIRISLAEFSKGQATWNQMPMTMIRKVALVNALREAFPDSLGAMYTEDEGDITERKDVTPIDDVQQIVNEKANQKTLDFDQQPEVDLPKGEPVQQQKETVPAREEVEENPFESQHQASFDDPGF